MRLALLIMLIVFPSVAIAQTTGINPIFGIIQFESSGNPTATTSGSTSSGLAGELNGTWREALAACGGACGTTAQFPTAASAPAATQIAATNALINSQGLQPWLCAGCDAKFSAYVAAHGGASAFQTSGLDTNPADFAGLNTAAGLQTFLASDGSSLTTTNSGGGGGGGAADFSSGDPATAGATGSGGAPTSTGGTALGGGILDQIVLAFQNATQGWQGSLFTIATDLFWLLALIDLAAAFIMLIVSSEGHGPGLSAFMTTLLQWLFPVGLFWWLLNNGSTFAQAIVDSLRQAANMASGAPITPSAIITAGVNAASTIWTQFASFFHPVTMMGLMLAAVVIVICFALMATWMAAALIEAYFIIGAAALFLAFAGMRFSRDIGINLLRFAVAIGFKLFGISVIVGVGMSFVQQWALIPPGISIQGLFMIVGAAVFLAAMSKVVPDTMQRVILSPVSMAHYSPVTREAAGTAAIAAAPVLATAGFTAMAVQAFREAAEKMLTSDQQPQSSLGRAGQMALGVGSSLASAAGSEISGRISGLYRGGASASAARMASRISQNRQIAAAEQARPAPPTANTP